MYLEETGIANHEARAYGWSPPGDPCGGEKPGHRTQRVSLLAALDPTLDLILADYSLPQFNSLQALQLLREREMETPFIIVSGTIGEERAVNALRLGATDYILKDRLARLGMAVTQALQDTQRREEQRHAAIALQRAKEEAEAANRLKSDFLAMMSHELRTPLHITVGYLDLLLEGAFGALTEEQRTPIQRIDSNVRRLLDLILATLDVTLLEAGQVLVELSEVHLEEFLPELQEEILQAQTKSGVSLQWQIAPGLPVLHTDRRKLKIVLANLLGNAQKFTSAGTITLVVFPQGEGVAFWVQDTGIGIGPEVLPHIFERFRQGESVRKRHYEGVGLGLYIVQLLLELLEGTITVKSVLGQGSTFRVWLPLRTSAELKTEPSSFQ